MRYIAHNGEINTLRGNLNLMKAREGVSAFSTTTCYSCSSYSSSTYSTPLPSTSCSSISSSDSCTSCTLHPR